MLKQRKNLHNKFNILSTRTSAYFFGYTAWVESIKFLMDFIKESFSYKVTLVGGKELYVEGHKGLSAYTENEINIRIKGAILVVKGEALFVMEINEDELLIRGKILSFGVVK